MFGEEIRNILTVNWLVLIPALPLLGFLINGLGWIILRDRYPRWFVNWFSCLVIAASMVLAFYAFWILSLQGPDDYLAQHVYTWLQAGENVRGYDLFTADFGILFDRLSATMCVVVTLVGFLIHVYATGYMAHDPSYARFFSYMNLFMFAMLTLVSSDNIVMMFIGWEGVGLCSYLLIGFWYEVDEFADAGKKAFIVNRIGDAGFLIGIFTIFWAFKTVNFVDMQEWITEHQGQFNQMTLAGIGIATFIGVFLFIGAIGKSAQIPLYVWLPDAMAGPTPVSALIHAATMVTAGIYMIARMNFLYIHSSTALAIVACIGGLTALYAGTIGLTQNDIKKVLAYSTVSQLGYMFLAMGAGAFAAGIFHLATHAFFKALLFLGAGSVIVAFHHQEKDMRKMGALRKFMPWTYLTMLVGTAAIIGMPPFAGFFSKDEILWKTFSSNNPALAQLHLDKVLYVIGIAAALITAVYMCRLIAMTFHGQGRMDEEYKGKIKESPSNMTIPLVLLAIGSAMAGFLGVPHALKGHNSFENWLEPVTNYFPERAEHAAVSMELSLMGLSVALAVIGIVIIYYVYILRPSTSDRLAQKAGWLYRASLNKYYVDEIYDALVVEPTKSISYHLLYRFSDVWIIDGIVNAMGWLAKSGGELLKRLQTGVVQTYAFYFMLGVLAIIFYLALPAYGIYFLLALAVIALITVLR
jgi:NADH-quinone oxidoreductase subunit L